MRTLLFLAQRIPYPPNKGDKIRSFAVLRHLSARWRIHLGCFVDDPADRQYVDALKEWCAEVACFDLDPRLGKLRALGALAGRAPLSQAYFADGRMRRWVGAVLADRRPQAAFLYSSVMGQYLAGPHRPPRVVVDFVDVDSEKWRQYAQRQPWPLSWVYGSEARRLLDFDARLAEQVDASIFVSPAEAALFRERAPRVAAKVHAISNGIDLDFFRPGDHPPPERPALPYVAFTGAMDYWPNQDAVLWFADKVLPRLRDKVPDLGFAIVGSNPGEAVRQLAARPGITVTGRVADVRPYLAHAAAVVAPVRVARGIQNKVLEGMAMGKPVVTTPQGLEGIDAEPGRHLLVASGADDFAAAVRTALAAPGEMGAAARARMEGRYGWADKLAAYSALLET